jgi:hypothetical protein
VKALVNAVDHLGTVAYKLNDLLNQQTAEISSVELRAASLAQRMRSCQEHSDREGLKQQSLAKTMHVNHKHYVLPGTSLSPPPLLQSKGAGTCGQITMCQQLHNLLESYDFQMRQVLLPTLGRIVIVIYSMGILEDESWLDSNFSWSVRNMPTEYEIYWPGSFPVAR